MAKQEFSITGLAAQIPTEADAYRMLERLRWAHGEPDACPKCGSVGPFYFLTPANGTTRATRTGKNDSPSLLGATAGSRVTGSEIVNDATTPANSGRSVAHCIILLPWMPWATLNWSLGEPTNGGVRPYGVRQAAAAV